jgi:hypothetical protein
LAFGDNTKQESETVSSARKAAGHQARQCHRQNLRGQKPCQWTNYRQFALAHYDGAKRVKKRFPDLDEAKQEAELAAPKLASGEGQVLRLTSLDRAHYLQAQTPCARLVAS